MNLLDGLLALAIASAVFGGWRIGLLARLASWVGLVGGLVLAAMAFPRVLELVPTGGGPERLLVTLGVFLTGSLVGAAVGEAVGGGLRRAVRRLGLGPVDAAGGAALGGVALLALVWLLAPAAAAVPGPIAHQVRNSAIASWVGDVGPDPPDALQALRHLVGQTRFPDVFEGFEPSPQTGPPPEQIPVPPEVVERVVAASSRVESVGCRVRFHGSAFAIEPDVVMTNAHVVAGADELSIRRPDGEVLAAEPIYFDPDRDLALLRVPGLGQEPLPVGRAEPGTEAVVVGYPGGQREPRAAPATVETRRNAIGRDIYGRERSERRILILAADLARGDSGGPVVDGGGAVVGVVFAISPDRPGTAFALDEPEIRAALDAPREVGVGPCM